MRAMGTAGQGSRGKWLGGMAWVFFTVIFSAVALGAQPSWDGVKPVLPQPALKVGEGLAVTLGDGEVRLYGEAQREAPMGGLAKLVWMRLEGAQWSTTNVQFRCQGASTSTVCRIGGGHGRVGVGRALQEDCDLAFLAWIQATQAQWKKDYGDDAGRVRLEEAFAPFLGRRLPPGEGLSPLTPAWVGDGDLLRTSPDAFLRWLMEPDKAEVITFGRRFLSGFWGEVKDLVGKEGWWFMTATAPVPGVPSVTSAWVAGGRGPMLVVFHLPRGKGKPEGLARLREILGLKS